MIAAINSGTLTRITSFPAGGEGTERPLFTVTSTVWYLDTGADGSVYFSEIEHSVIGRVTPDGIFHIFAGAVNAFNGSDAEGALASQALVRNPGGLAFGPDGSLYYVARNWSPGAKIRRISPDGRVYTVAGNGTAGCSHPRPH